MWSFGKSIIDGVTSIFKGKHTVEEKKVEKDIVESNNDTENRKVEAGSQDTVVRNYRACIFIICIVLIFLEAFGFRLWVMAKLGIDATKVDFTKIFNLMSHILTDM